MRTTLHYGPVHTNALSFEYAHNATRLGLLVLSTLYAERFHRKRIDLKTLLPVDQNENAYISF